MTAITTIRQFVLLGVGKNIKVRTVEKAVRKTLADFSQKYPEWTHACFDEHFLVTGPCSVVQQVAAGNFPSAANLSEAWANQLNWHHSETRQQNIFDLTLPAAEFLNQLRVELDKA